MEPVYQVYFLPTLFIWPPDRRPTIILGYSNPVNTGPNYFHLLVDDEYSDRDIMETIEWQHNSAGYLIKALRQRH